MWLMKPYKEQGRQPYYEGFAIDRNMVVKKADKGPVICLMNKAAYIEEALSLGQLGDMAVDF